MSQQYFEIPSTVKFLPYDSKWDQNKEHYYCAHCHQINSHRNDIHYNIFVYDNQERHFYVCKSRVIPSAFFEKPTFYLP